jgi:uncharacterized protein YhbP (UPF0306 family)
VASVYFAGSLGELYFLSSTASRHGRNLTANPRVAAAINEDEHEWRAIRGIQLEGECRLAQSPPEHLRAWRAYIGKFPFVRDLLRQAKDANTAMAAKLLHTRMYVLRPTHLFYLDNWRGFGERREITNTAAD